MLAAAVRFVAILITPFLTANCDVSAFSFVHHTRLSLTGTNIGLRDRCRMRRCGGCRPTTPRLAMSSTLKMNVSNFGAAYEWVAKQRDGIDGGPVSSIRWFDIQDEQFEELEGGEGEESVMPLYPLGACYVPSMSVHTLNNVEPRNVRMAKDLEDGAWDNRKFCVTLRASDTGRVASIGTIMRLIETDEQLRPDGTLARIVVKCIAEEIVEIVGVANPDAWSGKNRLLRSNEYLKARVRPIGEGTGTMSSALMSSEVVTKLVEDYNAVRRMYVNTKGVAARELPPFAADSVKQIPTLTSENFGDNQQFWEAVEVWQTLCYTVREGRRSDLNADINEIMVAEAIKKGGMLKLPVHRKDMSRETQLELKRMEEEAAIDFVELGLDPCLDFQALLSLSSFEHRLDFFAAMVSRERKRLDAKQSLAPLFDRKGDDEADPWSARGAWFE